jgi:tRNA A37 methylthiotransferase MiaB
MFDFTVASGYTPYMFRSLVQLGTPEAVQAVESALRHVERNEDFRKFLDILIEEGKTDVLRNMKGEKLSKQKAKMLRDALDAIEHDVSSELS